MERPGRNIRSPYWHNGGRAWVQADLSKLPIGWSVAIPTGRSTTDMETVVSLADAVRVAAERDCGLEVDAWTYELMVQEGAAPPSRPAQVLERTPAPGEHADRQGALRTVRQTHGFIGLSVDQAVALAGVRGLDFRIIDETTNVVTADFRADRLNLRVISGKVQAATLG